MITSIRAFFKKKSLDKTSSSIIAQLEKKIGTKITRPELFLRALRHRSYIIERKLESTESYEQLEFLGDAVLDLIVSDIIFERYSSQDEGFMTQLRSKLVKGEHLAKLGSYLKLESIIQVGHRVKNQGIEQSKSVQADIFEAVIGALYKDAGYDKTYNFVSSLFDSYIDLDSLIASKDNYKSMLLEYAQANKMAIPEYEVVEESGPGHDKTFRVQVIVNGTICGQGVGKNKKKAEQLAAREALYKYFNLN